jgi:hypothetical protein
MIISWLNSVSEPMSLRIRQIVLAARDLAATVAQFQALFGIRVCYRDPEVEKFGLENALMAIGDQFLEVVSPIRADTAVGRHLDRHGDSGYMLILQTDDLARAQARLDQLSVRIVWRAAHPDIKAVHLHPKDIGAALISIDEATPPESWRWAGPNWKQYTELEAGKRVLAVTLSARYPDAMSRRWAQVLGAAPPAKSHDGFCIQIDGGALEFIQANTDVISGFRIAVMRPSQVLEAARSQELTLHGDSVSICGTAFQLAQASELSR